MFIISQKCTIGELFQREDLPIVDFMKLVVDVERELVAANAGMHADLEMLLLEQGSKQSSLYGVNLYPDGEIEYDSLINPPRNREAGFPRVGRYVADPAARERIQEVVEKWVEV